MYGIVCVSVCFQRQELTSLEAFIAADAAAAGALHAPLTAIVDFCGFRTLVMSKMQFSDDTLVYGVSPAGFYKDEVHAALLHCTTDQLPAKLPTRYPTLLSTVPSAQLTLLPIASLYSLV